MCLAYTKSSQNFLYLLSLFFRFSSPYFIFPINFTFGKKKKKKTGILGHNCMPTLTILVLA
jgi:hypothetical protein